MPGAGPEINPRGRALKNIKGDIYPQRRCKADTSAKGEV
jgi:hypothetical protein